MSTIYLPRPPRSYPQSIYKHCPQNTWTNLELDPLASTNAWASAASTTGFPSNDNSRRFGIVPSARSPWLWMLRTGRTKHRYKCKLARASWVTMWLCDAKTLWSWGTWKIWHSSTTVTAKGRKVQLLWVDHDEKSHWLARSGRSTCWWMHTRNTCHHVNASAPAMTLSNG